MAWSANLVVIKTQFSDQFRESLNSQLIKGISKALQKLLRYFNVTIISTFLVLLLPVWPVIFCLILNKSVALPAVKSVVAPLPATIYSSLQHCNKTQHDFEKLSLYSLNLCIDITRPIY